MHEAKRCGFKTTFLEVSLSNESLETFKKSTDDGLSSRLDELSGALQERLKD